MQFYSNFPTFKTETTGFLNRIQSLLAAFPGAAPAPPGTFKDTVDAQEWTINLLDDTLGRVDDAVTDAKRANDARREGQAAGTSTQAKDSSAGATTGGATAPIAKHRPAYQGFISYMQSPLQEKPQALFDPLMDNTNSPHNHNFNNLKESINVQAASEAQTAAIAADQPVPHPLQAQLDVLTYPDWQVAVPETAHKYKSFEETPFVFIDTLPELEAAAVRLAQAKEIAVDLEAHNYRSFQGFCCLMQLSTREEDQIVDVIALRSFIGPLLAPIFANPGIVKVLHGSDGDIVWLQRDFGIYMCNLFDTGQAARVLNYSGHGLGYMLDRLCGFKADKRWQLADWRLRPLSDEAIHYARADTHYLLHCYDRVRQELAKMSHVSPHLLVQLPTTEGGKNPGGALGIVLERSRQLCLQMYEKELLKEDSFMALYDKTNKNFNDEQLSVFMALYSWRDKIAREEDESFGYVLSRAQLITLAETRPITVAELSRVLGKGGAQVQKRAKEVLALMAVAKKDTAAAKQAREDWKIKVGDRIQRAERAGVIEVLPDMAAAYAAASAHQPPPQPPQEQVPQEVAAQPSGLKPRAIKPLNSSNPAADGTWLLDSGPSAAPAAPAEFAGGLKPRAVVPLGGSANAAATAVAPKLSVAASSSLFGSLLTTSTTNGDGTGVRNTLNLPLSGVGYGGMAPVSTFAIAEPSATIDIGNAAHMNGSGRSSAHEAGEILQGSKLTAGERQAAVRAAMTQLAADQAQDDIPEEGEIPQEAEPKEVEELADFMPLALSDKYGLKRKQKRQQTQHGAGFKAHKKQRNAQQEADQEKNANKIFKELGLVDNDDEEERGEHEEGKVGRKNEDEEHAASAEPVDYSGAAAKYDFGIVNPHAAREGRGGRGGRSGRGRGGGRDRGRGRGGRGGRGKADEGGSIIPEGRFNPYAALDLSHIKGGKQRSAVHVRSGNRSSGFK